MKLNRVQLTSCHNIPGVDLALACDINNTGKACSTREDCEGIWMRFSRMFSLHSLIQNALVNNDALVNLIKQSMNLKFAKSKKVSQDYLLKLVQEKKVSQDFNGENHYYGVAAGTKRANILALMYVIFEGKGH